MASTKNMPVASTPKINGNVDVEAKLIRFECAREWFLARLNTHQSTEEIYLALTNMGLLPAMGIVRKGKITNRYIQGKSHRGKPLDTLEFKNWKREGLNAVRRINRDVAFLSKHGLIPPSDRFQIDSIESDSCDSKYMRNNGVRHIVHIKDSAVGRLNTFPTRTARQINAQTIVVNRLVDGTVQNNAELTRAEAEHLEYSQLLAHHMKQSSNDQAKRMQISLQEGNKLGARRLKEEKTLLLAKTERKTSSTTRRVRAAKKSKRKTK